MKLKVTKRRRWRRRAIKKFKPNRTYLERHEREVIMEDARNVRGAICTRSLMKHAPGRYDQRYLARALKRLAEQRYLVKDGTWGSFGMRMYRLPDTDANRKAA